MLAREVAVEVDEAGAEVSRRLDVVKERLSKQFRQYI